MRLLHAPHGHAKMHALNHHADTVRIESILEGCRNLLGQALLHLHSPSEELGDAHQLGEAHNLRSRARFRGLSHPSCLPQSAMSDIARRDGM